MAKTHVSKLIRSPRQRVWSIVADLERWPCWAPEDTANRIRLHKIVSRPADNAVICDGVERAWFMVSKHRDQYTLRPPSHIEETMLDGGDMKGYFKMNLKEDTNGTLVDVESEITPTKILPKTVSLFLGDRLLRIFWIELLQQLSDIAEAG